MVRPKRNLRSNDTSNINTTITQRSVNISTQEEDDIQADDQEQLHSTPRHRIPAGYRLVRDEEYHELIQQNSKPKIQVFKGLNDKISIENWLKLFEIISNNCNWSDKDKVIRLSYYLQDDALNFYIENYTYDYDELTARLINRFGHETVDPIVEFANLKYDIKLGIKQYFDKKRRLGTLAKLTEEQMVPLMIQGLHPKMIEHFIAVKPKTFSDFYKIAKTCEDNYKQFKSQSNFYTKSSVNRNNKHTNDNSKAKIYKPDVKNKRKPPNACRICEGLGFHNRFHWMNECKNNTKNSIQQTNAKQINTISNDNDNENSEFPQLERITLN